MNDFRFLEDNCLWIIVIIIFLMLLCGNGCGGCGGGFNFDCLGNLFNGCGNNSWLWILIIIFVIWCLCKDNCGCGIFRNDMQ